MSKVAGALTTMIIIINLLYLTNKPNKYKIPFSIEEIP